MGVEREPHWWLYCCREDDVMVRQAPTRATNQNTKPPKKLRLRQRCFSSEKVTLSDGDAFIHINFPYPGWVPLRKKGGGQFKMEPKHAVDPAMGFPRVGL